jgi:hypothetical protein
MKIVIKYSWYLYKKILGFNKLLSINYLLIIPAMGVLPYLFLVKYDWNLTGNPLCYILYYVFLAQTFLIIGKRVKNEFFFSSRSYTIFPRNKITIMLYILVFGIIDLNTLLLLIVALGATIYFTSWNGYVYIIFLLIFAFFEIVYLSVMIVVIEYVIEKFGTSKNLLLITFIPFFFFEFYVRLAEKFYLINYIPISGWIGSTVNAAQKGDISLTLFYFCISIIGILSGLLLLDKVNFPKKNYVS